MNSKSFVAYVCYSRCLQDVPLNLLLMKRRKAQVTQSNINKNTPQQLTDKDLFGNETTLAVSEEDIQAALDGDEFRVPLNSPVILVQSGNRAPETIMQEEMRKYYTVSTFSGIPDRQKPLTCNKNKDKNENEDVASAENMNWMQALRFVAAKGHQKAIIVYQDMLQTGKYDSALKSTVWSDYKMTNSLTLSPCATWYVSRWWMWQQVSGLPGRR